MYEVLDISRYIINKSISDKTPISNLKLQKLLFYVQAYFLVETGSQLFSESLVSWKYGPVVIEAYDEFKSFGALEIVDPIEEYTEFEFSDDSFKLNIKTERFNENIIENNIKECINEVVESYESYNAIQIMRKTHQEDPWLNTENGSEIDLNFVKSYFNERKERILGA